MVAFYRIIKRLTQTVVLLELLVLSACREKLAPDQYVAWIQDYDHGLHAKREYGDYIFDAQFQPADFFKLTDAHPASPVSDSLAMQYYLLKISCKDTSQDPIRYHISNASEWQQRIYYYAYLFQNDIYLEENGVKYPCVLYHFEQSDISTQRIIALGFETPAHGAGTSTILIESQQFGSLPLRIEIVKEKIPELKV
jgi:hypothetical protein